MKGITPCFWFDNQGKEAAKFYVTIFKNSKVTAITRYSKAGPGLEGSVQTVSFKLAGQEFVGLNGGPVFKSSPAISFVISCETQK